MSMENFETSMNRRSFVKGAGLAGAGALAAYCLSGCAPTGNAEAKSDESLASTGAAEGTEPEEEIEITETRDVDVVVIGSGMSGGVATLAAAEEGLSVVCLEKLAFVGGTSGSAEGMFGLHSKIQDEQYFSDPANEDITPEELFVKVENTNQWSNNTLLARRWIANTGNTVDWCMDHGMELVEIVGNQPDDWPMWHVYEGKGKKVIETFLEKAEAQGAEVLTSTPAKKMLFNDDGSVAAVIAVDSKGNGIQFNCKAAICCSGGFACNKEMMEQYTYYTYVENKELGYTGYTGCEGRMGDCIKMGQEGGADLFHMGIVMGSMYEIEGIRVPEENPVRCMVGNVPVLWVNEKARRYCNEHQMLFDFVSCGENSYTQKRTYSILDSDIVKRQEQGVMMRVSGVFAEGTPVPDGIAALEEAVEGDEFMVWKADTIEELAEKLELDPIALKDTVDYYNSLCDEGHDAMFMKDPEFMLPVKTPPFYGVKILPTYMTTLGGLAIDERMRVTDPEGKAIKGLYACGSDAGGLYGYMYDAGLCFGSQQSFCAVGARFAVSDIANSLLAGGDGEVSSKDLFSFEG